ncbi:MAG TPA: glycosyltransferase [Conexibacter sp.]|jgi:GT2 family glycosyltransferase/SAM-dependent methyltransferase|nr:glycosyltransferase [Conexibacter sp.]
MAIERRAGAPRLIEWTGERCVPWTPDVQVVYEHYHRYLWAAELAEARRVLDIASGEGFGSAILAGKAAHVTGIDIDPTTVQHSQLNYAAPNLEFREGSALELEAFEAASFDLVVTFELIEHVTDHERVLAGIQHVLAPDGLLVISTPDRRMYTDATGADNPYHEHELTEHELRALLGGRFEHVRLFGQRAAAGSRIAALEPTEPPTVRPYALRRAGEDWREAGEPAAMYLVAVASAAALPELPAYSTLNDYELTIVHPHMERAARAEHTIAQTEQTLAMTRQALDDAAARERGAAERAQEERRALAESFDRIAQQRREIEDLEAARAGDAAELHRIRESVVWNTLQRARGKLYGALGGHGSRRARTLQWSLRAAGRTVGTRSSGDDASARPAYGEIRFPTFERPVASLVVTAHRGAEVTAACLRSIADHTEGPAYEVIVVDDAADAENAHLWEHLHGARVVVNDPGIGYLRSVNRGAAAARGRYLVLMNNDVEVQLGWLRALVAQADAAPDVGAVAAKLVYPDGSLQEAGGIVFRDGSAANFGNGGDPDFHEFDYVREVDYGSAACLLVRRDAWVELGGYDERYLPMYYEDADLCFGLRSKGYRVMYEPTARVVHHEGATAGTDTSAGSKRHQELNRPKFADKWRTELERDQLRPSPANMRRASNRATGPHVLVIDHRIPLPDHDAGSLRMLRLVESLQALGCRVTFVPDDGACPQPYTQQLQASGVDVIYGATWMSRELAAIGGDLQLAIVSRPYVAAQHTHVLREYAPRAVIAYDTVDLHYVREQRRAEVGVPHAEAKAATIRELELGLVRGSDVTLVVSEEEREQLEREAPGSHVIVVPVVNEIAARIAPLEGRAGVLFVGGFEHPPNVDAAVTLVNAVMPLVWQRLGDVPVVIAGSKPTPEVEALAGPNVEVTGWVEDLQPLIDGARAMVAPLRYGAGMKGKVTQSLGAGLPVVTTPTGAEGLGAEDGRDLLIADDAAGLAERIVRLHADDELWRELSTAGQDVVRRVASIELMRERLAALLALSAPDAPAPAPVASVPSQ